MPRFHRRQCRIAGKVEIGCERDIVVCLIVEIYFIEQILSVPNGNADCHADNPVAFVFLVFVFNHGSIPFL